MNRTLLIADGGLNDDPSVLDIMKTQQFTKQYPAAGSHHFLVRVKTLMKFITSSKEVFGRKVKDSW